MAINQVSLLFYPPRWQQRLRDDPELLTWEGKPVQIASAEPREAAGEQLVAPSAVAAWLVDQGFTALSWGQAFERGRVRSMFGQEKEIIVHVNGEDEVSDLYCRFTLPHRTAPSLDEWAKLVEALCEQFELRLAPNGPGPCRAAEFLEAVRDHQNFREFAARFKWER